MFTLDLFKPLAGPRCNMESRTPRDAFDSTKPIDDPALTFKTDSDAESAALPPGAVLLFIPTFIRIDPPMRCRGRV